MKKADIGRPQKSEPSCTISARAPTDEISAVVKHCQRRPGVFHAERTNSLGFDGTVDYAPGSSATSGPVSIRKGDRIVDHFQAE